MAEEGKSLEEITKLAKLATERMGKLNSDSNLPKKILSVQPFNLLRTYGNFLRHIKKACQNGIRFVSCIENSVDPDELASEKPADLDPHCFSLFLLIHVHAYNWKLFQTNCPTWLIRPQLLGNIFGLCRRGQGLIESLSSFCWFCHAHDVLVRKLKTMIYSRSS